MSNHCDSNPKYPNMTTQQLAKHRVAVAEELAGRDANIAMVRELVPEIDARVARGVAVVEMLKQARIDAGVSLDELQQRTGMPKSALSRLENSQNPNPTLATLSRYAEAIGKQVVVSLETAVKDS